MMVAERFLTNVARPTLLKRFGQTKKTKTVPPPGAAQIWTMIGRHRGETGPHVVGVGPNSVDLKTSRPDSTGFDVNAADVGHRRSLAHAGRT